MKTNEVQFSGTKFKGIPAMIICIVLLCVFIWLFSVISRMLTGTGFIVGIILNILFTLITVFLFKGFTMIEPNDARVLMFFGKYVGTLRENGYWWVNPFYTKKRITYRARNMDGEPIKVNDKSGNPILIGQVIVWRVYDTYKASFNIDTGTANSSMVSSSDSVNLKMKHYENFVKVQGDAALRQVAGMYAYDNTHEEKDNLTLRSGGDEINELLSELLNERLNLAGIEIVEARINYLAYAPEIAAVMLRRQQADAIISAREKIVEGAVSMVKMALDKLSEEEIIELDDDKKAAMVTNLMVVLCSDEPAQPIVNSGTLYT